MAQSKFSIIFFLLFLFAGSLSANQIPILKPEIRAPILKNSLLPLINWNTINLEFGDDDFQAALFERSGWYWFFFNQKNIIDIHDVLARKNESYYEYEIIPDEKNLIFRVKSNFFPNLIKEGKRLQIEFGDSIPESIRTLEPIVNRASVEIAVFNNIQDYTQLIDPDIDDQIFIVPGNVQEATLEKDYNFTYFNLLNSRYGVVINSLSDQVKILIKRGMLYIYHPPLMIYNLTQDELTTPIFKFQEWFDDGRDFLSRLEEL